MGYYFRCQSKVDQSNCLRENTWYMVTEDNTYEPIDTLTIYTSCWAPYAQSKVDVHTTKTCNLKKHEYLINYHFYIICDIYEIV
jgi:hypothetical protein